MTNEPWYIGERAQALSLVYLTRLPEVLVQTTETEKVIGLDLLVEIMESGISKRKVFGVQVKSQVAPVSDSRMKKVKIPQNSLDHIINNIHIPVCLFFFTLENDEGYYAWIKEPFINEDKLPKFRPNTALSLSKLDNAALERIIGDVNAWYNALFQALAA